MDNKLILIEVAYILSAVLFMFGLKRMAHPRTAVRGNLYGAMGMLLALWFYAVGAILLTAAGGLAFWASPQGGENK